MPQLPSGTVIFSDGSQVTRRSSGVTQDLGTWGVSLVRMVGVTPDHSRAVAALTAADTFQYVRVYTLATDTYVDHLIDGGTVFSGAIHPDGIHAILVQSAAIRWLDIFTGELQTLPIAATSSTNFTFSVDGSLVYVGRDAAPRFDVVETTTWGSVAHTFFVISVQGVGKPAVSPDGQLLAYHSRGSRTKIYDIATETLLWQNDFSTSTSNVFVSFSPDSSRIAISDNRVATAIRHTINTAIDGSVLATIADDVGNTGNNHANARYSDDTLVVTNNRRIAFTAVGVDTYTYAGAFSESLSDVGPAAEQVMVPPVYVASPDIPRFWTNYRRTTEVL